MQVHNRSDLHFNASNLQTPQQSPTLKPLGEQIQQQLFPNVNPRVTPLEAYPQLAELLFLLNKKRKQLASLAEDHDDDYRIVLTEDTIAAINGQGTIFMGAPFLLAYQQHLDLLVGVLAHEIGHRPKYWQHQRRQIPMQLTIEQMAELCRAEEAKADTFAGIGLAEFGMSAEPVANFIRMIQQDDPTCGHPQYLPADVRAEMILNAHSKRAVRAAYRRKLFPEHHRFINPKGHIGVL